MAGCNASRSVGLRMMNLSFRLLPLSAVLFVAGCGGSNQGSAASGDSSGPQGIVNEFLEAVRSGDDERVADLLTAQARRRTAEMEIVVAPPGSDTARFKVHDVDLVDGQAHVRSEWTDLDSDGLLHTDEIIWILRQENGTWRISGMMAAVRAGQDPIVLNFEEPREMLRRQQLAEEELARREQRADSPRAIDGDR